MSGNRETEQASQYYRWTIDSLVEACQAMAGTGQIQSHDQLSAAVSQSVKITKSGSMLKYTFSGPRDSGESLPSQSGQTENVALLNCLKSLESSEFEIFNDPVHGSIELHPLLVKIVNTPAFNRLKNIKQLGGVYHVFHGATHTRFEHSIGTCYIAGEFMRTLQRKQPEINITDREVLLVEIAALCHDLGQGPFSKVFNNEIKEKLCPALYKKEKLSSLIFEHHIYNILTDAFLKCGICSGDCEQIVQLIDHDIQNEPLLLMGDVDPKRRFLYEIVANKDTGIDTAKWDYFARDCYHLGIANEFDWRRLMKLSRVIEVNGEYRICYRDKESDNIAGMFRTRSSLHRRAYQHATVVAVEHMIGEAICKVQNQPLLYVHQDSIPTKISIKRALEMCQNSKKSPPDLEGFLALTDSITELIMNAPCSDQGPSDGNSSLSQAKKILRKLEKRDIPHLLAVDRKPSGVTVTEEELFEEINPETTGESQDVFMKELSISYDPEERRPTLGNETTLNQKNPVNFVYFYSKETPWKAQIGRECFGEAAGQSLSPTQSLSVHELPETTEVKETRVYAYGYDRKRKNKVQKAFENVKRRKEMHLTDSDAD